MARRIQERLLVALLAIIVGVLLPAAFLVHRAAVSDVRSLLHGSLIREARLLAAALEVAAPTDLPEWVARMPRSTARVTVISPDGRVQADSEMPADGLNAMENHGDRPEVKAALRGNLGSDERRSQSFGRALLYVAAPVGNPPRLVVRLAVPTDESQSMLGRVDAWIWLAGAVALVMAVLLSAWVTRSVARPLSTMTHAVRSMGHGDFGRPLPDPTSDELGDLIHALETLRSQLQARIDELRNEGKKLRTILNGMDEGVALIQEGAITVANPAFGRLLGVADTVEGRGPLEVSRLPSMAQVVDEALAGREARRDVQLGARSLLVQAHPLGARQAVLVLFDTTETKRLERLRRDFVANASHELRTPVAAIVGVADTLAAGAAEDPEARQSFVDILTRHARRLERLTADLLDLARMEGGYKPRVESVPVESAVDTVVSSLRGRADEKRITLEVTAPPGTMVRAERAAVEQILTNLLDNALKYTPDGGRVKVSAVEQASAVRLQVEDTGPGIAGSHLPRLFERFYRVDSARSRELGGTGLGLSIARHLALANGGDIGVESQVGKGSRFFVDFPRG